MINLMERKGCMELLGILQNGPTPRRQSDFVFADDNEAFAYMGYWDRYHHFWIAMKNDDDMLAVNVIRVWLGPVGRVIGEVLVEAEMVSASSDEVIKFIQDARSHYIA